MSTKDDWEKPCTGGQALTIEEIAALCGCYQRGMHYKIAARELKISSGTARRRYNNFRKAGMPRTQ